MIKRTGIIGAIVGDIIGSAYEFYPTKNMDFELFNRQTRFTDDTVMTLAVAQWLMTDPEHTHKVLIECMKNLGRRFLNCGYGRRFKSWLSGNETDPYHSWGNGSGMRVSPIGFYAASLDEALQLAKISAEVTHNHPEGIKGAQAIATCIFFVRQGKSKREIRPYVENTFGYDLHRTINDIRPTYQFEVSCQKSVPEAIIAYLDGNSYENVIRLAISLGGDADTLACMAGAIAAATDDMSVPESVADKCYNMLDSQLRNIFNEFNNYI